MNKAKRLVLLGGVFKSLGVGNVARVAFYRLGIRLRLNSVFRIQAELAMGDVFRAPASVEPELPKVYSWEKKEINHTYLNIPINHKAPDWFYQKYTGKRFANTDLHWSAIPDFDPSLGDIKVLWDLSRMDWIIPFCQQALKGDMEALQLLNQWLRDWQANNTPYRGVNWKCGQEAGIRVLHLLMGAFLLQQINSPTKALVQLVQAHLKRITPTVSYAIGQSNNHSTSEAAALFLGGSFLLQNGCREGGRWQQLGRRVLESSVATLIGANGTFSQYSLNYHRLMLDTLSCCEFLRQHLDEAPFSKNFYRKAELATNWLYSMTDRISGDGPNIGANDGARILPLSNCGYRDFRPTVQLAMILFQSALAYEAGPWNEPLRWLKINTADKAMLHPASLIGTDGGFGVLRLNDVFTCLRFPRFTFRPSQNDLLHVDLWANGINILKDGGSFSYNADSNLVNYFGSIGAHNSIQFDDREPMEKISRFLYAGWVKTNWIAELSEHEGSLSFGAGYTDYRGACHKRNIVLTANRLVVVDTISSFQNKAALRWRMCNRRWMLIRDENEVLLTTVDGLAISITADCTLESATLSTGFESLYYLHYTSLPVVEVVIKEDAKITTTVTW